MRFREWEHLRHANVRPFHPSEHDPCIDRSMLLAFHHVGPALERGVTLPKGSVNPVDYGLVYDPQRRTTVYVTAPDYHQVGHAWTFDGASFAQISDQTYRLGSQCGPWYGGWDPAREAAVMWAYDGDTPYGVVIGPQLAVVLHDSAVEDHRRMGDKGKTIVVGGQCPVPTEDANWNDLPGVLAIDPERRVTVSFTQHGIFELDGATWKRVADSPELPDDIDGDRQFSTGAGAVWDATRHELLFWFHDDANDGLVFVAWNGTEATKVPSEGLPELLGWGDAGFAIGDHPKHGVVIYIDGKRGLFARGDAGWTSVAQFGADAPPRGKGGQLCYDAARDVLIHGPFKTDGGAQNVFYELHGTTWKRIGATTQKSVLGDLSSGFQAFARDRGVMHAIGLYLKTVAWDPSTSWQWRVDDRAGDDQRKNGRVQAVVTAWDGAMHALLDHGGTLVFDGTAWKPGATGDTGWKDLFFPLAAFDPTRGVIVAWGNSKKSRGRKNDTYLFDGKAWTKCKTAGKTKPADIDVDGVEYDLYWDAGKQMVARLGKQELAHFDGKTWIPTKLTGALPETWRRCVCPDPATGNVVVVNVGERTVIKIDRDGTCTKVGDFMPPAERERHSNLPFDRWWFDETSLSLVVHNDVDDAQSFAMDLRACLR